MESLYFPKYLEEYQSDGQSVLGEITLARNITKSGILSGEEGLDAAEGGDEGVDLGEGVV